MSSRDLFQFEMEEKFNRLQPMSAYEIFAAGVDFGLERVEQIITRQILEDEQKAAV